MDAGGGSVTGVDVCLERLSACRTLVAKYGCGNTTLVLGDGTTFDAPPPSYGLQPQHRRTVKMSRRKRRAALMPVPHCTCALQPAPAMTAEGDDGDDDTEIAAIDQAVEAAADMSTVLGGCAHRILHRSRDFRVLHDPAQPRLYDKACVRRRCSSLSGAGAGGCGLHARRVAQGVPPPRHTASLRAAHPQV